MVRGLIADGNSSAWSFGSSMITFVFPMILFIAVAAALYVLYTKPELIPGHRETSTARSVSHTFVPGEGLPPDPPRHPGAPTAEPKEGE